MPVGELVGIVLDLLFPITWPYLLAVQLDGFRNQPSRDARCQDLLLGLSTAPGTMDCDAKTPPFWGLLNPTLGPTTECSCEGSNAIEVVPGLVGRPRMLAQTLGDGRFNTDESMSTRTTLFSMPRPENGTGGRLPLEIESFDHSTSVLANCQAVMDSSLECECEVCEDGLTFKVDCSQQTVPVGLAGAGLPGPKIDSCINFAFVAP